MKITISALLVMALVGHARAQEEGAEYLQNAIRDIQNMQAQYNSNVHVAPGQRRVDNFKTTQPPPPAVTYPAQTVPPLTLTKSELAAIYETAASKGSTIKLNTDNGPPINALVHELNEESTFNNEHSVNGPDKNSQGYYYYYYPLQSFIDELSSPPPGPGDVHSHNTPHVKSSLPQQLIHSHTHQHNVLISSPIKALDSDKKPKGIEPLFMAISGFVGMAVMFVLSVLFIPRLGILKSRGTNKPTPGEVTNIARIALEAIEGRDCAERLACEIGKRAKAMNLYDNRFVKLFRRMAPPYVAREIDRVGKYTQKRNRCVMIRCKRKTPIAGAQKINLQPKQPKNQPAAIVVPKKKVNIVIKPKIPAKFKKP